MHIPALIRGGTVAVLLLCSTTWAQTAVPHFELERLELNTGQGSLLSGNGELLVPGGLSAVMVGHYQHRSLMLTGQQVALVNHRASVVLAGSYGVLPWLEVGAQVPAVLWQKGSDSSSTGRLPPKAYGLGTPALQARFGLLSRRQEQPVDLAVDVAAGLPVGSKTALARDEGMRFRARATMGGQWGWLRPALEGGVLLRPPNPLFGKDSMKLIPELRLGAGVATAPKGLRGELALQGAFSPDSKQPSLEVLGGVRLPLTPGWELLALGGTGMGRAPGTPHARVLLGLNFRMEPPPGLERLTEAIPQFRLEQEPLAVRGEVTRLDVEPVPTRELVSAEPPPASAAPLLLGAVLFEPGRAELSGDLRPLQELATLLRSLPGQPVINLEGHAGLEREETADRLLPLRRAQAVWSYLAEQGVPLARMRVRLAPPAPLKPPTAAEDTARARRVEVHVSSEPASLSEQTPE
jgi:outer membrane protein OmpA-like peptidoglycan-associated protein